MLFVVLCPGTSEGSIGSGSGFKASQKTGQRLKVSPDRLGKAGNRTCDPWFTRHRFIPYTIAASPPAAAILAGYCSTVNSEIFARVLFSMKIKSLLNGEITLSLTDIDKSCPSREFLKSQICLLTLIVKIKFSRLFHNLQYLNQ